MQKSGYAAANSESSMETGRHMDRIVIMLFYSTGNHDTTIHLLLSLMKLDTCVIYNNYFTYTYSFLLHNVMSQELKEMAIITLRK